MIFDGKKVLLALANPPAENWLAAKMEGAEVKKHPADNGFSPDVVLIAERSNIGKVYVGFDDPVKVISRYVAYAPVVLVVADSLIAELQQIGVSDECFILPESTGANIRVSRVYSVMEELVNKDIRLEPVVFGSPAAREKPSDPVIFEQNSTQESIQVFTNENPVKLTDLSVLEPFRNRIVIFTGPGAGKTTLAASFAACLTGLNERVSLIDMCSPPALRLHLGNPELKNSDGLKEAETEWGTVYVSRGNPADTVALIAYLAQDGYVVIDAPAELAGWLKEAPVNIADIIDDDIRTLNMLEYDPQHLLVANRVPSASTGTWPHVVAKTVGKKPDVIIEDDVEGVQASIDGYLPAGLKSRAVSVGAAEIGKALRERGEES